MVTSQEIAQAQAQAVAEQQRLAQAKQQLTSQQVLRSATRQGQIQIKTQAGRIEAGQRQLTAQQTQLGQIKREVQDYEAAVAKQQQERAAYEEGYRLAIEDAQGSPTMIPGVYSAPTSRYLAGHDPEYVRGYLEAKKAIAEGQIQYGTPATTLQFGTEAQKSRLLPEGATNVAVSPENGA